MLVKQKPEFSVIHWVQHAQRVLVVVHQFQAHSFHLFLFLWGFWMVAAPKDPAIRAEKNSRKQSRSQFIVLFEDFFVQARDSFTLAFCRP